MDGSFDQIESSTFCWGMPWVFDSLKAVGGVINISGCYFTCKNKQNSFREVQVSKIQKRFAVLIGW